jgi:ankyrin repeat protein
MPQPIEPASSINATCINDDNKLATSLVERPYFSSSSVALLQRKQAWFEAARSSDLETLQRLFLAYDRQRSLNDDDDSSGLTALGLAASGGHLACLQWLLEQRAWPYYGGRDNQSPLQLAIEGGHDDVACWLIENGADLNALDQTGTSPIRAAAGSGNFAIARLLLEKGAIARGGTTYGIYPSWTSLLVAIQYGHLSLVQLLFEAGVPIPPATPDGLDVLDLATRSGNDQLVDWLLANG